MKHLSFAILIITFISISAQAEYSGGSGTAEEPYRIATKEDLLALAGTATDYNKCFILTSDINLAPDVFTAAVIAPDTDNSNYDTYDGNSFTGLFDGAGYKITNLTINTNGAKGDFVGLFGYIDGGEIKNLGLENAIITDGNESHYISGLVGHNTNGSISNCYSTGTVTGGDNPSALGGLVGENDGNISNCYSTVTITGGYSTEDIGGLVGDNDDGSVNNCYSTGNIYGGDGSGWLGGLVGDNDCGSINNCYSTGVVTSGTGSEYFGGLVGGGSENVSNSYFLETSGPDNDYGQPLTDVQMRQQSNFVGWDFVNTWNIGENQTYPFLRKYLTGDLNYNGRVDFVDFAVFADNWLKKL
jgi:hypothetical protein